MKLEDIEQMVAGIAIENVTVLDVRVGTQSDGNKVAVAVIQPWNADFAREFQKGVLALVEKKGIPKCIPYTLSQRFFNRFLATNKFVDDE